MASINERLEAEEAAPWAIFRDDRVLTPFERDQLAYLPTRPIYWTDLQHKALDGAEFRWRIGCRSRRKDIPATYTHASERVRAEGQP